MPSKLLIALALAVLLGALAMGNPFLRPRGPTATTAVPPVVTPVALRTMATPPPSLPPCPVPALQELVVAVHFDATGEPSWQLRDGRVLRRDAATAAAGH